MRTFLTIAALWSLLALSSPLAQGASDTLDVAAIKPGMKGYGLTVFRGQEPERFDVEVIDVLANFRPDQDLILIRTPHPVLDQALAVGGMSGSPIFLEGKLVGAYAYGWMFGKAPIAGVTPIANMLAELVRPVDPEVWKALGTLPVTARAPAASAATRHARLAGLPPELGLRRTDALSPLREHARLRGYAEPGAVSAAHPALVQASTPIMLGGLDDRAARLLSEELAPFGLVALQAGGGATRKVAAAPAPRFVNGGAIGVQLIRGDINATAIGTVTHIAGKRLAAFGHPMMNAGQPALPTCTARVLHVLASQQRSFKIAEAGAPIGTLIHDRQAAIVVDTTLKAATVPMRIRLEGVPGAQRTEWNLELASQRLLTPMLAFSALLNALSVSAGDHTDVMFDATTRVTVSGHGELTVRDRGYTPAGVGNPVALGQLRLFDLIQVAYGNPFEDVRVERIDVDIDVRFGREVLEIIDARVHSSEVDPGRDLNVYLTLQRFGKAPETKLVVVPIPERAAGQKIELVFESGTAVDLERPVPESLAQIFDNVRLLYPSTSLVVSTKLPAQGLRVRGHVVRDLPGSALDTLQLTADAQRGTLLAAATRIEHPLGHVVVGSARLPLDVRLQPLR